MSFSSAVQMDANHLSSLSRPLIGFAEDAFLYDQTRGNVQRCLWCLVPSFSLASGYCMQASIL